MEEIKNLVLNILGEKFLITAGGSPGPDSVGTEEVKNHTLQVEDLDPNAMVNSNDVDEIFNSPDIGQGGGEDTDDDETGFETVADDGEGDI